MEKFKKLNNRLKNIICFLLVAALFLTGLTLSGGMFVRAFADEDEYTGIFETTQLDIANNQFESSSGSYPKSPGSWTGAYMQGSSGSVIAGVIDLTASEYTKNAEELKLDKYKEYSEDKIPQTPFGRSSGESSSYPYYKDTNTSVLMINTDGSETAYAYSSSSITLAANSHYRISTWVKTGDFGNAQTSGATVKLTGLGEDDIAFYNINTVRELAKDAKGNPILNIDNMYGWQQFTFYIATGFKSYSTTLSLQVGEYSDDYFYPTKGYAFFDNITAFHIAPEDYIRETAAIKLNTIVKNLDESEYITKNDESGEPVLESGNKVSIGSFENDMTGWSRVSDEGAGGAAIGTYDARGIFTEDNFYSLISNPTSPMGVSEAGNNILVISSPNKKVAAGIKSNNIVIKRNQYYRVSAWVKTEKVVGGKGASVAIRGENTIYDSELNIVKSDIANSSDKHRYNWTNELFYIKGSAVKDCLVHVELWLGQLNEEETDADMSRGIAMFDDITIETITAQDYSDNVSGGTEVTLDGDLEKSQITNGLFYTAGTYEEYKYPLPPASWTPYGTDSVGTEGHSNKAVDNSGVVSGIMPTDTEHFESNRVNYLGVTNPIPHSEYTRNVLFIGSRVPTAYCYRSSERAVSSGAISRLYVSLKTSEITGSGANLVLKSDNRVLSTIENINTDGEFRTYSFYIQGAALVEKSVTVEIWLGLNDRQSNHTKLASGFIFVEEVNFELIETTDSFSKFIDTHKESRISNYYTFSENYFNGFDRYDDNFVKYAYNWTLAAGNHSKASTSKSTFGIFDYTGIKLQDIVPKDLALGETSNRNILYLSNDRQNAITATSKNTVTLDASKYYAVSVRMKVDIPEIFYRDLDNSVLNKDGTHKIVNKDFIGAGISLSGTDFAFKNIVDGKVTTKNAISGEMEIIDSEFKTYTFYVKTKTEESTDIGFIISLGGTEYEAQFAPGSVYVSDINVKEIENTEYDSATKDLEDDDRYVIKADMTADSGDNTEEPGDDTDNPSWLSENWYVIPSAIFGAALLIALLAIAIRKFLDRRASKKQRKEKKGTYDRRNTLEKENYGADETESAEKLTNASYDDFDEDIAIEARRSEAKPKTEKPKTEKQLPESETKAKADKSDDKTAEDDAGDKPEEMTENVDESDSYKDDFQD